MAVTGLRERLPGRRRFGSRVLEAVAVAVTWYVLGATVSLAAGTAVVFLALLLTVDTVGDYADNAALGLLTLLSTGYFVVTGAPLSALAAGGLVGGWLCFDGVQHLRHGETREEVTDPFGHDGSPVTGLGRALWARLLEPFRL